MSDCYLLKMTPLQESLGSEFVQEEAPSCGLLSHCLGHCCGRQEVDYCCCPRHSWCGISEKQVMNVFACKLEVHEIRVIYNIVDYAKVYSFHRPAAWCNDAQARIGSFLSMPPLVIIPVPLDTSIAEELPLPSLLAWIFII